MHKEAHPLAGQRVKINLADGGGTTSGLQTGDIFRVEDWWDHLTGGSWMHAVGNPAALAYAVRTALADDIPCDNEVVYGHVGAFGHLIHAAELGEVVE